MMKLKMKFSGYFLDTVKWCVEKLLIWMHRDSKHGAFCKGELNLLLPKEDDDSLQKHMNDNIAAMCGLFSLERHSGASAAYANFIINRLLDWNPVTAIEDNNNDWKVMNLSPGSYMHKRAGRIQKEDLGNKIVFYDAEGYIFEDSAGGFNSYYSKREITEFPHDIRKSVIIPIPDDREGDEIYKDAIREAGYEPWPHDRETVVDISV